MASVTIQTQAGKSTGEAELVETMFGVEPNMAVMHQVVTAQLAARRAGTHSTNCLLYTSDAADGNVIVVDKWDFETPKTADAKAALSAIGAEGKVLIVFGDDDTNAWKSFRNLTNVHCLHQGELNTYDVLNNDVVVFTEETLPTGVSNAAAASTEEEE